MSACQHCRHAKNDGSRINQVLRDVTDVRNGQVVRHNFNAFRGQSVYNWSDHFLCAVPHGHVDHDSFLSGFTVHPFSVSTEDSFRVSVHWAMTWSNDLDV